MSRDSQSYIGFLHAPQNSEPTASVNGAAESTIKLMLGVDHYTNVPFRRGPGQKVRVIRGPRVPSDRAERLGREPLVLKQRSRV